MGLSLWDTAWLWFNVLVYTAVVLFGVVKGILQAGVKKYFHWETVDRPAILDDPDLGKHGYLHLEVGPKSCCCSIAIFLNELSLRFVIREMPLQNHILTLRIREI